MALPFRFKDLLFAATLLCAVAGQTAQRPNIILCMADDMGWGDPSYNSMTVTLSDGSPHPDQGWINTPTMDAMASNGIRFDRFYSASAVCSPTRASCLTGRNPFRVGVPGANSGHLGADETPLSELLSNIGYRCGHFGKWHLGTLTTLRYDSNRGEPGNTTHYSAPWHHSYDVCFATEAKVPTWHPYRKEINGTPLPTSFVDTNFYGTHYWRMPADNYETAAEGDAVPVGEVNNAADGDDSRMLANRAISFIREAVSNDAPFFVVLWFHTPHKPLVDPEEVEEVNSSDSCKDAIEDMDEAIGMVRTELENLGVRGDTMFWFTSDNGPENGVNSPSETDTVRSIRSGRMLERKRSLYEGGVRVPGILEWPNVVTNGFSTAHPAFTSDYYPTILDYLELSVPEQKPLDGISLRPLIEGTTTERSKPMGFKISLKSSWVADRYKLIQTSSSADWELYDLDATTNDLEIAPLATSSNILSQTPEIQALFNSMLAEYNAWNASVSADTSYIHGTQPAVVLSTSTNVVSAPFTVSVAFSEPVTGLDIGDFSAANGSVSNLSGSGTSWTITVTPSVNGTVSVTLTEGAVFDLDGNPNGAVTPLEVYYAEPGAGSPIGVVPVATNLPPVEWQTVDSLDNVPGNLDNNLAKFNSPPTTLYVRSSGVAEKMVRALVRFDVSMFTNHPVGSATLEFDGYSLNSTKDVSIETIASAADWAVSGSPVPTFDHPTIGSAGSGGSIISNFVSGTTRGYSMDVTEAVQNWTSGIWTNHGLIIRLAPLTTTSNGLGIHTNGLGTIRLNVVENTPLMITDFTPRPVSGNIDIEWNSASGAIYRVEYCNNLRTNWNVLGATTSTSSLSSATHTNGLTAGITNRFYRITTDAQ